MINELNDKVSKRRSILSNNLDEVKNNISYLVGQHNVREQVLRNTEKELEEIKGFRLNADTYLNDCLSSRDTCKLNFEGLQSQLEAVQVSLSEISSKSSDIRSQLTSLRASKLVEENEVRSKYDPSISSLDGEIRALEKQIRILSAISDVCPTCGQKLQGVEKPDISPLETELSQKKAIKASLVQEKSDKLDELHNAEVADEQELVERQKRLSTNLSEKERVLSQLKRDVNNAQATYLNSERVYNEAFAKVNSIADNIEQKETVLKETKSSL